MSVEADFVPDLPRRSQRWTMQRKATLIRAVRGGYVSIDEICKTYNISVDEFLAWERDIDRYGVHGLRTTRFQISRDTDKTAAAVGAMSTDAETTTLIIVVAMLGIVATARWFWH